MTSITFNLSLLLNVGEQTKHGKILCYALVKFTCTVYGISNENINGLGAFDSNNGLALVP